MPRTPTLPPRAQTSSHASEVARALEAWAWEKRWRGPDPYDALNATRVPTLVKRAPLSRRVLTQAVKRSPIDLRPVLGIPPGTSAVALAQAISSYARNGFLPVERADARLRWALGELLSLRCRAFGEPCWGYHFDVQTRAFFYPRSAPNTIATAFAASALLDAYERLGSPELLQEAAGAGEFFLRHVPQTPTEAGAFFGYLAEDRTPIHNANMLVCALLARLGRHLGRAEYLQAAGAGVEYTVARQRPDGSWPYGETRQFAWVDNFHTGYVLESLMTCLDCVAGPAALPALERGLDFYARELFLESGAPKYRPDSLHPIDAQCVAQGIQTFALAGSWDERFRPWAWRVFDYAVRRMRRQDGTFLFQRRRFWRNSTPHVRWVVAPMLAALTHLLELER